MGDWDVAVFASVDDALAPDGGIGSSLEKTADAYSLELARLLIGGLERKD
jgi:hypothetical protein